jgi:hypothetical protein
MERELLTTNLSPSPSIYMCNESVLPILHKLKTCGDLFHSLFLQESKCISMISLKSFGGIFFLFYAAVSHNLFHVH